MKAMLNDQVIADTQAGHSKAEVVAAYQRIAGKGGDRLVNDSGDELNLNAIYGWICTIQKTNPQDIIDAGGVA